MREDDFKALLKAYDEAIAEVDRLTACYQEANTGYERMLDDSAHYSECAKKAAADVKRLQAIVCGAGLCTHACGCISST